MRAGSTQSYRLRQERGPVLQPLDPSTEAHTSAVPAEIGTNLFYEAAS